MQRSGESVEGVRYVHTNVATRDWRRLARFYERVFGCERIGPERDLSGDWLARGTGVPGARLRGVHLRLPGWGPDGPTLEIFEYDGAPADPAEPPTPDRPGWGHIAFAVRDADAVRALLDAVVREGGARLGEVVSHPVPGVGALTFAYARDPDDNPIELQAWDRGDARAGYGS